MKITHMALTIGASAAVALAAVVVASNFKPGAEHSIRLAHACGHCAGATTGVGESVRSSKSPEDSLEVCVVSGEALGSMGAPYTFTHQQTEVRLCCRSCLESFHQNAEEHLKKVRAAAHPAI